MCLDRRLYIGSQNLFDYHVHLHINCTKLIDKVCVKNIRENHDITCKDQQN